MIYEYLFGILFVLGATLISSISQILLKKSADCQYTAKYTEYFNRLVIAGYTLLLCATFINVFALRWIPLSLAMALDASGQVFVPLMSYFFLREKMNRKKCIGMLIIIVGILIFSL